MFKGAGKKILIGFLVVIVGGYALLFTGPGNSLMGKYVQMMINSDPNVPITVEKFSMQTDSVDMRLRVADVIDARVYGDYSLFGGSFDGRFELFISEMARINIPKLKEAGVKGAFRTQGTIQSIDGGYKLLGTSEMYGGDMGFTVMLDGTTPTTAKIELKGADLRNILRQARQAPTMKGDLNIVADFSSLKEGNLKGMVTTTLSNGRIDEEAYEIYYGKKAPKDFLFTTKVVSDVDGDNIISSIDFDSTFATLNSESIGFNLKTQKLWGEYIATIKPSDPNNPSLKMKPIETTGKVSGTIEKAFIDGVSAMYGSDTIYKLELQKGELVKIDAKIDGMSLAALSKATGQKVTADARLDVNIDIDDAREGRLDGLIVSTLKDFRPDMEMMKTKFGSELPKNFNLNMLSKTRLQGDRAVINSNLKSDVGALYIKDMVFYFDSGYLMGEYSIVTANFAALAKAGGMGDVVPSELISSEKSITIDGKIRKGKTLHVTGDTDILGGKVSFALNDRDLEVDIINTGIDFSKDGRSIYSARANGVIRHNLETQAGSVLFTLAQGETLLEVKRANYDAVQQKIDASILMSGYGKNLHFKIKGSLDSPDITMKTDKPLISKRYKEMMLREIEANIEDEKQKKDIRNLVIFLSKKDGTLTQAQMNEVKKSIQNMAEILKDEYKKVKNVRFTQAHFDNLEALSEKMRKERGILSNADMVEIERRSKAIIRAIEEEWSSSANKRERRAVLAFFERLGSTMSSQNITTEDMDLFRQELYLSIDAYQDILGDKRKIEQELKKYEALERVAKMFGRKDAFDRDRIFAIIQEFNMMMDVVQARIAQSDLTSEQQEIIRSIGRAFEKNSLMLGKNKAI